MKTKLLILFTFISVAFWAQTAETVSMGAGYAQNVYYKLSTQTETTYPSASWDLAFYRNLNTEMNIRVNHQNVTNVYVASTSISDWSTISVSNESSWTSYYNSATNWSEGAFYQPRVDGNAFDYGWGLYNLATHHVVGNRIFVLKFVNGDYYKVLIQDFYGGYTFKYAKWDATGSVWNADQNVSLPNSQNTDRLYNYYSLQNDQSVVAEPANTDWDFVFMKYFLWYNNAQWYLMTGALHHPDVTVAENIETGTDIGDTSGLIFSEEINTIGDDWKTFSGTAYTVNSDKKYYLKYADNTLYRLYFTDFVGSSNGNISFNFQSVTLGYESLTDNVTLGIFPNPTENKQIHVVYELKNNDPDIQDVQIVSATGQVVHQTTLSQKSGFYNQTLDLQHLPEGVYFARIQSGNTQKTIKIILQ